MGDTYLTGVVILKEMPVAPVPQVEVDDISCEKAPHALGQGLGARPHQEVKMLCEALNYVKLSFFISGLPFIVSLWLIFYYT